jgi:thiol-disulfide isomerase/thioredoxin
VVVRLLLVATFVAAGLAKLADREGARRAAIGFGVPARLAGVVAVGLPLVELAVAVLLVPTSTAVTGAACAVLLLGLFSAAIARSIARGQEVDCHCFGQLHSAPAGWPALARNAGLVALALLLVAAGEPGARVTTWAAGLETAELVAVSLGTGLAVAVGGAVWLGTELMHQQGRMLLRIDELERSLRAADLLDEPTAERESESTGLAVGAPAPAFRLPTVGGGQLGLKDLLAPGRPLLLVFEEPGCGPCRALMPAVARWQERYRDQLRVVVVSGGDPRRRRDQFAAEGLREILIQHDSEVSNAYGAYGTPTAVGVAPDGTIATPVASGVDAIRALCERIAHRPRLEPNGGVGRKAGGATIGCPAPPLSLPDLSGRPHELAELRGRDTLLLFWNPDCGFCHQMLPNLRTLETTPHDGPRIVLVSTADRKRSAEMDVRSLVLLDPESQASSAFGARGTPMAVLLDESGRVASPVAAGRDAILELTGGS